MAPEFLHQCARVVCVRDISADDERLWRTFLRESLVNFPFVGSTPLVSDRTAGPSLTEIQRGFQPNTHSAAAHQNGTAMKIANHKVRAAFVFSCIDAYSRSTRPS